MLTSESSFCVFRGLKEAVAGLFAYGGCVWELLGRLQEMLQQQEELVASTRREVLGEEPRAYEAEKTSSIEVQ